MKRSHLLCLATAILSAACAVPATGNQASDLSEPGHQSNPIVEAKVACFTHYEFDVVCSNTPTTTTSNDCQDEVPITECVDETSSGVNGDCTYSQHYARTIVPHACVAQPVENIHPL